MSKKTIFNYGGKIRRVFALLSLLLLTVCSFAQTDTIVRVGACATPGRPWSIYVKDTIAYIADCGAFTAINIVNPSNPYVVGTTSDVWAQGFLIQDTFAYLNATGMQTSFDIASIANPESLYRVGWCHLSRGAQNWWPTGICIIDTIVYLAVSQAGIAMVNVSNPSSPETLGWYDTPGYATDFILRDTILYVADFDSLLILCVSDPLNPFRLGAVHLPTSCWWGVAIRGNYAYVTGASDYTGRLAVVDISNPTSPHIVDSLKNIRGHSLDIQVSGNYAYITACDLYQPKGEKDEAAIKIWAKTDTPLVEGGLRIVNISNPYDVYLVASYDTPGDPRGIFVNNDLIFVADDYPADSVQILRHITGVEEKEVEQKIKLVQNCPNPFNSKTTIVYRVLNRELPVKLKIYDITGNLVREILELSPNEGNNRIIWDRKDENSNSVPSGIYFYRLSNGSYSATNKLVVIH